MNRERSKGWLPPSLRSRVDNIINWVVKLRKFSPVTSISLELVRFDPQKLENPEISGVEYQQGTLAGYEIREYILEKWGRRCTYCGKENIPLQIEHILARANGGTDRVSNLTLSCEDCNQKKGTILIEDFIKNKPELLKKIQSQAKSPLKDAAAVNATRWEIWRRLTSFGLPVECGSGGRTKFNRTQQGYPKAHWIDAACVGESGERVILNPNQKVLKIKAMGRGQRQVCRTDKYGFPRCYRGRSRRAYGFQTGDLVRAEIPKGKYTGTHVGRVTVRPRGHFRVDAVDVNYKYVNLLQRVDGYQYSQ